MNDKKALGNFFTLNENSDGYKCTYKKFVTCWTKSNITDLQVERIWAVDASSETFNAFTSYKEQLTSQGKDHNTQSLYHGTNASCTILETFSDTACDSDDCSACSIVKNAFNIAKIGTNKRKENWQRFGHGFYFSRHSSKCHYYSNPSGNNIVLISLERAHSTKHGRRVRIMLECEVALGNTYLAPNAMHSANSPPQGFDSIYGRAGYAGLNYEEYCVFRPEACLPTRILAYSFTSTTE